LTKRTLHYDAILVIAHPSELKTFPAQGIHHDVHVKSPLIDTVGPLNRLQLGTDKIDLAAWQDDASIIAAIPSNRGVLESVGDRRGFRYRRMKEEADASQYEHSKKQVTFHLELTSI
jgi:hypothetical protein